MAKHSTVEYTHTHVYNDLVSILILQSDGMSKDQTAKKCRRFVFHYNSSVS